MRDKLMRYIIAILSLICLVIFEARAQAEDSAPQHTFTVRGIVRRLPSPDAPRREVFIRHERIPGFVNMKGEVDPMPAMTMPFELAGEETFEGIAIGDEIEFTYDVWWGDKPKDRIRNVKKLAPGTVKF